MTYTMRSAVDNFFGGSKLRGRGRLEDRAGEADILRWGW